MAKYSRRMGKIAKKQQNVIFKVVKNQFRHVSNLEKTADCQTIVIGQKTHPNRFIPYLA